jgi:hypothetical protein
LFQSFQINLQAFSLDDAVNKLNHSLMIGPYILAISGNSRYIELQDTGYNDLRITAWEISHDTRTEEELARGMGMRIGLPERYFKSIEDYLIRILRYPFILYAPEDALNVGIGLTWLDTRIKFVDDTAVVEFRVVPTQPTIEDEMALMLFYIGRLFYSQMWDEPLMPMKMVQENREVAIKQGLSGEMWHWKHNKALSKEATRSVIESEISKANLALMNFGVVPIDNLFNIFGKINRGTPSEILGRELKNVSKVEKTAMVDALCETGMMI